MKPRPPLLLALVLTAAFPFSGSRLSASPEPSASPASQPAQVPGTGRGAADKPVVPAAASPAPAVPSSGAPSPAPVPVPAAQAPASAPVDGGADKSAETPAKPDAPAKPGAPVEPPRLFDGGVPADAAEFQGVIKGCVETVGQHQASFRIKITCAQAGSASKAKKPDSLISAVVLVIQGADKGTDGKWKAKPGHHEWVAALQPGSFVTVPVRYTKAANGFRMTEVPAAPVPPESCGPAAAVASGDGAGKK